MPAGPADLLATRDAPAAARERRVVFALKQRLSRYELPEDLRLEHSAGEHDAFDNRYRGMARRLDQRLKAPQSCRLSTSKHIRHIKANHENPPAPVRRSFHMVAWTRMAMYEEDVDSERMHLDEGRGYELSIVIRRDSTGFDEMLNEAVREKIQKQNAEANSNE